VPEQNIFLLPPPNLKLQDKDVHVWCASFKQLLPQVEQLAKTLSEDEKKRAERFVFEQDQINFMLARGLLRIILSRYLKTKPQQLQFTYNPYGKPALTSVGACKTVQFNLSHSEGMVLYAFTRDRKIGIDLEYLRPIPELDQIIQQFFSVSETAAIRSLPNNQKQLAFFQTWTCKEAYLKATGTGLSQLRQVEISLVPGKATQLLNNIWSIQTIKPAPNYIAAMAVEGQDWTLNCWQWSE
jgi:4'-phosphopantetheinyl transferase